MQIKNIYFLFFYLLWIVLFWLLTASDIGDNISIVPGIFSIATVGLFYYNQNCQ